MGKWDLYNHDGENEKWEIPSTSMGNGEVRFRSSSLMRSGKYDHDGEKWRSGSLSDSWQSTPQLRRKLSSSEMQQSTTKNNAFSWV